MDACPPKGYFDLSNELFRFRMNILFVEWIIIIRFNKYFVLIDLQLHNFNKFKENIHLEYEICIWRTMMYEWEIKYSNGGQFTSTKVQIFEWRSRYSNEGQNIYLMPKQRNKNAQPFLSELNIRFTLIKSKKTTNNWEWSEAISFIHTTHRHCFLLLNYNSNIRKENILQFATRLRRVVLE